jgi:hypothetical protein
VVRPGGLELPTFWFVAVRSILPNLARGVANRTDSASWGNSVQSAFSSLSALCFAIAAIFRVLRYSLVTGSRFAEFTSTSTAFIKHVVYATIRVHYLLVG